MKKIVLVCLAALCLSCGRGRAQSTEAVLTNQLVGKPLLLRGFWMDDKLHFDDAGQPIGSYKTGSFTESAFDAQKVTLDRDHLTIEGQRVALSFLKDGSAVRLPMRKPKTFGSTPEMITIVIDGPGSGDYSKPLDAVFADKLSEIEPTLPQCWLPFAQKHFLSPPQPAQEHTPAAALDAAAQKARHIVGDVKAPKVLYAPEPRFTEAARQQKFSGNVEVYFWLEKDGKPSHVTIVRPLGFGLDEAAVNAVSGYRFSPATLNGEPVKVDLYIDVNFRIF